MVQQILSSQCTCTASHTETEDLKLNCNLSLYLFCIWSTCRPSFHQHGSHSCTQTSSGSLVACRCCSGRRAGIAQPLTKRCCAPASKFWGGWAGRGWKLLAQNGQTYSTKGLWTSLFFLQKDGELYFEDFLCHLIAFLRHMGYAIPSGQDSGLRPFWSHQVIFANILKPYWM